MFDNTKGVLADVPAPIRSFYHEISREEPTGERIAESYSYYDDAGEEHQSTRYVDEYYTAIVLIMNDRFDLKSWSDVEEVKKRGNYSAIIHFIRKAHESDEWKFHDEYLAWLGRKPLLGDDVFLVQPDAESELSFSQEKYDAALASWQSQEPVSEITGLANVLGDYHQELAKRDVINWIESDLSLFGETWQVDERSRGRMEVQLGRAARNGLDLSSNKIDWILSDNSTRETTLAELGQVLDEYAKRQTDIVNQYVTWRDGDRKQRFIYRQRF